MSNRELFKKTESILYNYSMLKAEINNLELEIEEIENEYAGIGAISYEERSSATNKISDSIASEIIFKEKEVYRLNKTKRSKEILLSKINNALGALDENERKVVNYRYLNGKRTWMQVVEILSGLRMLLHLDLHNISGSMSLYCMEQRKMDHYSFMEIERILQFGKT